MAVTGRARRRGPKREAVGGLGNWTGRFIEARTSAGSCFRGKLVGIVENMLLVSRVGGRDALIPIDSLSCILDEDSPARSVLDDELGTATRRRPGTAARRMGVLDVAADDELLLDAEDA